jgi:hypothetical protein
MGPLTSIFGILEAYITFVERKSNPLAVVGRRLTANSQQPTANRLLIAGFFVRAIGCIRDQPTDGRYCQRRSLWGWPKSDDRRRKKE